jgi:hypothetical protein
MIWKIILICYFAFRSSLVKCAKFLCFTKPQTRSSGAQSLYAFGNSAIEVVRCFVSRVCKPQNPKSTGPTFHSHFHDSELLCVDVWHL